MIVDVIGVVVVVVVNVGCIIRFIPTYMYVCTHFCTHNPMCQRKHMYFGAMFFCLNTLC